MMEQFKLERVNGAILEPVAEHTWESRAAFNPGAIREGEFVHLLYRAVEGENYSTVGYAKLDRHGKVVERWPEPVIRRTLESETRGCEDVRIVPLEDNYYIFYTGYDGKKVRVLLAETRDFRNFHKYGRVGPDTTDKDAMIFPEKIGGKIAFLHRIEPDIQLAWFDSMEHFIHPEDEYWPNHLEHLDEHTIMTRQYDWEAEKIGAGPPPVRTRDGWLLIYHGVDNAITYRAGAALLDIKNPARVLARLPYPILEPEREYEKIGDVNNVVFPQGIAVFDDDLMVYYGGADKVVGLAQGKLSRLLQALAAHPVR